MPDKLKDLYREVILKHNSEPLNFGKKEDAQHIIEAYNPVCGDQFNLYFDLKENRIVNLSFHGYGCAISKASASIMTQLINGKSVEEALKIDQLFKSVLLKNDDQNTLPQELKAFLPVKQHPGRIKCVTLCWDYLSNSLNSMK